MKGFKEVLLLLVLSGLNITTHCSQDSHGSYSHFLDKKSYIYRSAIGIPNTGDIQHRNVTYGNQAEQRSLAPESGYQSQNRSSYSGNLFYYNPYHPEFQQEIYKRNAFPSPDLNGPPVPLGIPPGLHQSYHHGGATNPYIPSYPSYPTYRSSPYVTNIHYPPAPVYVPPHTSPAPLYRYSPTPVPYTTPVPAYRFSPSHGISPTPPLTPVPVYVPSYNSHALPLEPIHHRQDPLPQPRPPVTQVSLPQPRPPVTQVSLPQPRPPVTQVSLPQPRPPHHREPVTPSTTHFIEPRPLPVPTFPPRPTIPPPPPPQPSSPPPPHPSPSPSPPLPKPQTYLPPNQAKYNGNHVDGGPIIFRNPRLLPKLTDTPKHSISPIPGQHQTSQLLGNQKHKSLPSPLPSPESIFLPQKTTQLSGAFQNVQKHPRKRSRALEKLLDVAGDSWDSEVDIQTNLISENKVSDFICPSREGYFPDSASCNSYFQCDHGVAIKQSCQTGLVWNMLIEQCDWNSNVNCEQNSSFRYYV